jgi:hypothetical protein
MKKIILLIVFIISTIIVANACDLKVEIQENEKLKYKIGEEITVVVNMAFTHGRCDIDLKSTQINPIGIKIKGATDWKEISPNVYQRKYKIVITNESKTHSFEAIRNCVKGGGNTKINFSVL